MRSKPSDRSVAELGDLTGKLFLDDGRKELLVSEIPQSGIEVFSSEVAKTIREPSALLPDSRAARRSLALTGSSAFSASQPDMLDGIRSWVRESKDQRTGTAVFLDNSLLYACSAAIEADGIPAPHSMADLATLVRCVAQYDHVVHFDHPAIDTRLWNEILGDRVFIPVDAGAVPGQHSGSFGEVAGGLANAGWEILDESDEAHLRGSATLAIYSEGAAAARAVWATLLGRNLDHVEMFDSSMRRNSSLLSDVSEVLLDWTRIDDLAFSPVVTGDDIDERVITTIGEANHRSLFNVGVSSLLDLPHAASIFRAPMRRYHFARALAAEEKLATIDVVSDAVRRRAAASGLEATIPVFFSALLGRMVQRTDFWAELAGIRHESATFRRYRQELERRLSNSGSVEQDRTIGQINRAINRESQSLAAKLRVPLGGAGAATIAAALSGPAAATLTLIAMLSAWEKLDSQTSDELTARFRRPYELFLTALGDEATAMARGLPRIARIWEVSERHLEPHATLFSRMRMLGLS